MIERSVEDQLRAEYFKLLPDLRRVREQLETQIRCALLKYTTNLAKHQRLQVTSRIKDCDSAIEKLRGNTSQTRLFDPKRGDSISLTGLRDLVGIRVLSFPRDLRMELNLALKAELPDWTPHPFVEKELGFKYFGKTSISSEITAEYQILPSLVGMFWEVEHSAIYKPSPKLTGLRDNVSLKSKRSDVIRALIAFENEFAAAINDSDADSSRQENAE